MLLDFSIASIVFHIDEKWFTKMVWGKKNQGGKDLIILIVSTCKSQYRSYSTDIFNFQKPKLQWCVLFKTALAHAHPQK